MTSSYLKVMLISCAGLLLPFLCIGMYIEPLFGDLTRLGYFSERDFGWNAPQPVISVEGAGEVRRPAVVVLGDSFSAMRAWQAVATQRSGLGFRTYFWRDPRVQESSGCVSEWITSIKTLYPETRFVLLQTVEREFLLRFAANKPGCSSAHSGADFEWQDPSLPVRRPVIMRALPDPMYALIALGNSPGELDRPRVSGLTVLMPLVRGDLFSNRRSDLLLFFGADSSLKSKWSVDGIRGAAENVRAIQDRAEQHGITVIVLVIPDKSTIYSKYFKITPQPVTVPVPDVWRELAVRGVSQVDLKAVLSRAVPGTVDLYLPDDTHLGNGGYILIGRAVADVLSSVSRRAAQVRRTS